jgi:hypothetical protein
MNNLVSGQKDAIHELVEQSEPRDSQRAQIIGDGRILELRIGFDRKAENIRRLARRALQNRKQNKILSATILMPLVDGTPSSEDGQRIEPTDRIPHRKKRSIPQAAK